jgi:hypothetical protein
MFRLLCFGGGHTRPRISPKSHYSGSGDETRTAVTFVLEQRSILLLILRSIAEMSIVSDV